MAPGLTSPLCCTDDRAHFFLSRDRGNSRDGSARLPTRSLGALPESLRLCLLRANRERRNAGRPITHPPLAHSRFRRRWSGYRSHWRRSSWRTADHHVRLGARISELLHLEVGGRLDGGQLRSSPPGRDLVRGRDSPLHPERQRVYESAILSRARQLLISNP